MRSSKLSILMHKYANCPDCGSDKLDSYSTISAGKDTFSRTCSCGFKITVDEEDNEV